MYLAPRSAWLTGVGLLLVLIVPKPLTVLVWSAVVALLVAVDVLAAASPRRLHLERRTPRAVRLGETTTTQLSVTSASSRTMRLLLRDAWPPSAGAHGERSTLTLLPGQRRRTRTVLCPTRRGDRVADLVTVRSSGPLGLAGRQLSVSVPARLRVLPPFSSRRHLPSRLARLREMDGRSAVMVRGAGTEFDSLREYVVGDDVRSIDWRSTARRGDVVVRTWRPERDRRVLLVVDTGRMSAARVGGAPRLDTEVEAALLLAALASHAGDRVDAVAVDERLRAQVSGVAGPGLSSALADALAPVEASVTQTDWALVGRTVSQRLSQRALVIVLTGLDGSSADAVMTRALTALAREHTVVLASVTDPDLESLRRERTEAGSVYTAAAAERDLIELAGVRQLLRRAGVEVVEAVPELLAPRVADTYLDLKRAGRL
ncbi:DUF58 domain-containing protein [Actinomyces sp. W5033]|uniref:DUF58 domain-containing protein n=1 Tax=Actinomyces sp. W5033 TaxID=3446479 RepID=UPI003EE23520